MIRSAIEMAIADEILTILGPGAEPFEYTVGRTRRSGWRAPARLDAQEKIVAAAAKLRADDVRLFLSEGGTRLLALPGLPVLDVIELARVGTHNGKDGERQRVREVLTPIFERCPFDVVFADEAGLLAVFHQAPSANDAKEWSSAILDADWIDSYSLMCESAESSDYEDPVAAFLRAGRLQLWWD